ncbi:MAG: hypothetical protein JWQ66_358 [Mucilaginibacter sp.]|nr:hypothetical protein [Mucilaginibacter sp.]
MIDWEMRGFSKVKAILRALFIVVFISLCKQLQAQETGVNFETGLNWQQLLTKAKSQHKFIFVDCYASWCGPCKMMDQNTYPDKELGNAMNPMFISAKFQLDRTLHDDSEIKNSYADARMLDKAYQVKAYPTFLFFDPDGKLVHRGQGFKEALEFKKLALAATDPHRQYYTLRNKYNTGALTSSEQRNLALTAKSLDSGEFASHITSNYLKGLSADSMYTIGNVGFLNAITENSTDPGFKFFVDQASGIDKAMGKKTYASDLIDKVVIAEEIDSQIDQYKLNWQAIRDTITRKYNATIADRAITKATIYRSYDKDWPAFVSALIHDTEIYEDPDNLKLLNRNAGMVLQHGSTTADFQKALDWSKKAAESEPGNADYQKTYQTLQQKTKQP